jgi:hypothetical protein
MFDRRSLGVRLRGPLVADHRIPLSEFTRVTTQLRIALRDVAIVLADAGPSGQGGRVDRSIEESTDLRLVGTPRAGSLELDLELPDPDREEQPRLDLDLGPTLAERALQTLVDGLAELGQEPDRVPAGFDRGVLRALQSLRVTLGRGLDALELRTAGAGARFARIDAETLQAVDRLISRPFRGHAVAEGKLQMVDFRRLECRIDRPPLPSVVCLFKEEHRDLVQRGVRQFVRVAGDGDFPPGSEHPTRIRVAELAILPETLGFDPQLFWARPALAQLAAEQGVPPFALTQDEPDADGWRDDEAAAELIRVARGG